MPRGPFNKEELKVYVHKLKHELDREMISPQEKWTGHRYLSRVLDKIEEFRY